ncbi:MAG: DUF3789 domain-containing protein [Lachnospiraceae bacterium]
MIGIIIAYIVGALSGVVLMCLLQINRQK